MLCFNSIKIATLCTRQIIRRVHLSFQSPAIRSPGRQGYISLSQALRSARSSDGVTFPPPKPLPSDKNVYKLYINICRYRNHYNVGNGILCIFISPSLKPVLTSTLPINPFPRGQTHQIHHSRLIRRTVNLGYSRKKKYLQCSNILDVVQCI